MSNSSFFRKKSIDQILKDIHTNEISDSHGLVKNLNVRDLTFLGIAAIIGASIFSAIGQASANGGPAVSLLFVFTAVSCMFTAFCYARFAATVPISGSAYTYAYTSFGEIIAWILGWNLLLEYAISNVAVAISWSKYFVDLLEGLGVHVPDYITMDYLSAARYHKMASEAVAEGKTFESLSVNLRDGFTAWETAPQLFGIHFIANLPALIITVLITYLVYIGIKESKNTNNILVVLKLLVIALVVGVGAFYVKVDNWSPFAPNGISGVLKSVAAVCFAYIGFDSVSTTAEECKNPQRDIPRAMMYALIICTTLYVLVTLVLTGIVPSHHLTGVEDPLAFMFHMVGLNGVAGIVAASAVIALTSALLVYQLGQPRIWMTMARDGLLPQAFARVHKKYKTPSFATIMTGVLVGIPALFANLEEVINLSSIGTLFAFLLVCGGVLVLDLDPENQAKSKFKIPYINARFITGGLLIIVMVFLKIFSAGSYDWFFANISGGEDFGNAFLMLCFLIIWALISFWSYTRSLSLIPVLGLIVNLYLMTQMGTTNWQRFIIWCAVGFAIYFGYSYRKSKLAVNS
ncbi:Amino acid transporter [Pseudarcicella hirudinis]|uniref:Amino acid transporter n=1 Tax=Pseudarcicella hirudinis TaxID=1079859 RepID=A0A1I5YCT0_9BACT|nr:amino acid permease [Pseudarcicella hirudinis]SFQ42041.1 Amino acid transporter [Pseudarcicella hirudinis]